MHDLWKNGVLSFGDLLLTIYKELGLSEVEYAFLVLFARVVKDKPSDWSLSDVADFMTIDNANCSQIFMKLINEGFLLVSSESDETGRRFESYSLEPLFLRMESVLNGARNKAMASDLEVLFGKIEQVFGVLSPRDVELVQMWMGADGMDASLIELAMAEMQMHDIRSIRYVDKILLDWKKKNIYTVDGAKRHLIDFRNRKKGNVAALSGSNGESSVAVNPDYYYDWISKIKGDVR